MYKVKCNECYFFDSCEQTHPIKPCVHFYSMDIEFEDDYLKEGIDSEKEEYDREFVRYIKPYSDGNFIL